RPEVDPRTVIPLYSQTVAYGGDERRNLVGASGAHHELAPSSRLTTAVPAPAEVVRRARRFWDATAAWRARVGAEAAPGGAGSLASLAESAIQALWVLTEQPTAPVAAWTPHWRYVWRRDAAFCAVALARMGHAETALEVLEHLQS